MLYFQVTLRFVWANDLRIFRKFFKIVLRKHKITPSDDCVTKTELA